MSISQSNAKILLIGENAIDRFVYTTVERISPEAPVPVAREGMTESNPGMAANVKANIESLGGPEVDFYHQSADIIKTRYIDETSGQHLLRVDQGDDSFEPNFATLVTDGMVARGPYAAIVISDYDKGLLSKTFIEAISQIGCDLEIPVFLDTKKILGRWSEDVTFVKINEKEYRHQLSNHVDAPWAWCDNLIVTLGKDGCYMYESVGHLPKVSYHSPSRSRDVWSVAGAGDTVLAALVVRYLANGGDIKDAMDYSMKAAAVAVSKPGVVAVTAKEVEEWV